LKLKRWAAAREKEATITLLIKLIGLQKAETDKNYQFDV
jgi:hypothetical protein